MTKLNKFSWNDVKMGEFRFVAHLLDRVLIGEKGDDSFEQLQEAVAQDAVWEVHFFNTKEEIFAAREGEELVVYKPLPHREDCPERTVTRVYKLEESFESKFNYNALEVREYLEFDEDGLAYVESTVLYRMRGGRPENGV